MISKLDVHLPSCIARTSAVLNYQNSTCIVKEKFVPMLDQGPYALPNRATDLGVIYLTKKG